MGQTLQTSLSFFTHVDVVTFPRTLTVSTYLPANGWKATNKTLPQIKQHVAKKRHASTWLYIAWAYQYVLFHKGMLSCHIYLYSFFFIRRCYTLRTGSMVDNKRNLSYRNCVGIPSCGFFNITKLNFFKAIFRSDKFEHYAIATGQSITDPSLLQSKRNTE